MKERKLNTSSELLEWSIFARSPSPVLKQIRAEQAWQIVWVISRGEGLARVNACDSSLTDIFMKDIF